MADHHRPPGPSHAPGLTELSRMRRRATQHLLARVRGMSAAAWSAPSDLPGWTRGHVVAHLALNAEALAGALHGVLSGTPRALYRSPADRDADIDLLAASPPPQVLDRLEAGCEAFEQVVAQMPSHAWQGTVERVPQGPTFEVTALPLMRLREVELHHADLGAGYSPRAFEADFAVVLVESLVSRLAAGPAVRLAATDLEREWTVGDPAASGPETYVRGTAADLGWWLSGRGDGTRLSVLSGALPRVEPW